MEFYFYASYEARYGNPDPDSDYEEPTRWHLDWESEAYEDMETIEAESEQEAREIFLNEMIGTNGIPEDAKIVAVERIA